MSGRRKQIFIILVTFILSPIVVSILTGSVMKISKGLCGSCFDVFAQASSYIPQTISDSLKNNNKQSAMTMDQMMLAILRINAHQKASENQEQYNVGESNYKADSTLYRQGQRNP